MVVPSRVTPSSVAADIEADASDTHPSSVLGKAYLLLQAFETGTTTLGLTQLSRRSGVPKASAHRLAVELVALGLLERTAGGYQLGWRIYELGQLVPGPASLRSVACPSLMDLRAALRAVVHLAVPQGRDCVYLERFAGRRETGVVAALASRVPSHRTACGRIFLAHSDPDAISCADSDVLAAFGARNVAELVDRFTLIREQRFADERGQCLPGFKGIAVPVTAWDSPNVVAAISATTPVTHRDDQQIVRALWAAANDISRNLHRTAMAIRSSAPPDRSAGRERTEQPRASTLLRLA